MQNRVKLEAVGGQHKAGHKVSVREATFDLLRSFGMTTIFGNPGSTELRMFRDWPQDFRYVLGLQESVVVAMADSYAQVTRRAALVNLHSAGGVGHALGSVFTAYRNQTPLVIIAGQQTRAMLPTDPFLSARSAVEFPRPYVKWSIEPARGEDVPAAIAQAIHTALQRPCGPVFVSVPEDDWEVETDPVQPRQVNVQFAPDPGALDRLADALNSSRRPALVVGAAVDQDGAWPLAIQLAERLNAAVWESPMSGRRSFPEDHPLFAGFLPPLRQPLADRLAGHDVVVVIGAPVFTYHVHTGGGFLPEGTQLFHLTDDPEQAARAPVGTSILCTIQLGMEQLLAQTSQVQRAAPKARQRAAIPPARDPIGGEFAMHTIATTHAAECSRGGRGAVSSQRAARVFPDPHQRRVLRLRQRRTGLGSPGGRRGGAGRFLAQGDRRARGRLQPVHHSGAVERCPASAPDYLCDPQQRWLCGREIAGRPLGNSTHARQ